MSNDKRSSSHKGQKKKGLVKHFRCLGLASCLILSLTHPVLAGPNEDLAQAVQANDLKAVQRALQQKADPNAKVDDSFTAFAYALMLSEKPEIPQLLLSAGGDRSEIVKFSPRTFLGLIHANNLSMMRFLLEQGFKPNVLDHDESDEFEFAKYGHSFVDKLPLHYAGSYGQLQAAQLLLDFKAELNARASDGSTPLQYSVMGMFNNTADPENKNQDIIKLLLAKGADVTLRNDAGQTALELWLALKNSSADRIQIAEVRSLVPALGKGVDPLIANKSGTTPLDLAVEIGDLPTLKLVLGLVSAQARVKALNAAVLHAADKGKSDVLKDLLNQGADLKARDADGANLLMLAGRAGQVALVQFLLAKGLKVTETDSADATALHYAARGGSLESLRLLFSKAELEHKSGTGRTPLMEAAAASWPKVTAYLLDQGADFNDTDGQGATALMLAAGSSGEGRVEVMEQLLKKGALTTVSDYNKKTLLHYATLGLSKSQGPCGFDSAAAMLAARQKLEINARDRDGRTALMNAVYSLDPKLIELMLAKGADPALKSAEGKTAADELKKIVCTDLGAGDIPEDHPVLQSSRSAEAEAILTMLKKATK